MFNLWLFLEYNVVHLYQYKINQTLAATVSCAASNSLRATVIDKQTASIIRHF